MITSATTSGQLNISSSPKRLHGLTKKISSLERWLRREGKNNGKKLPMRSTELWGTKKGKENNVVKDGSTFSVQVLKRTPGLLKRTSYYYKSSRV